MTSEIGKFIEIMRRRWLVLVVVAVLGILLVPFVSNYVTPYKSTAGLLIVSEAQKDTTVTDPDLPSLISSTEVLGPVIAKLNLNTTILKMRRRVSSKVPPKSSILEVTYKDTDGQRAADVTNAIADRTAAYFHEIAVKRYADVIGLLNSQIAAARAKIQSSDQRLQRASADYAFVNSDKALDDLTSQINDLTAQRGQAYQTLVADRATLASEQGTIGRIAPIVNGEILQKDVVYQQLQTQLSKDVADQNSEKASFYDSFPGLSQLERRVSREKSQVDSAKLTAIQNGAGLSPSYTATDLNIESARAQVAADEQRVAAADQEVAQQEQHLRRVAEPGAAVGTLRAERDAATAQFEALTERLSAAQGDAAQAASLGTLVVVDRAIAGPSSLPMYLAGLAAFMLILGIVLAYVAEALDRRFWTDSDIEKVYGRPVIVELRKTA
jgi:capsular polysaccharide biosynthesis protein